MRAPAPLTFHILDIPCGDEARYGVSEEYDIANEFEAERTWTGQPVFFPTPYNKLERITYSASNNAILAEPAFDWVQQGQRCTLYGQGTKTFVIGVGQASGTSYHPIVPGSRVVATLFGTGEQLPVNVNYATNTVALQALQSDAVMVRYRPVFDTFVEKWGGSAPALTGTQTWSAIFQEWAPR